MGKLTGRQCAVPGCGRLVRRGRAVCREHARTPEGQAISRAVRRLAQDLAVASGPWGNAGEVSVWEERLALGRYRALLEARLREVLAEAGAARDLGEELGALRLVLLRVLLEEEDVDKLARNVSRVASAAARVRRVQEMVGEGPDGELVRFVERIADALALPVEEVVALEMGTNRGEGRG